MQKLSTKLSQSEVEIIKHKYAAPRIDKLSDPEILTEAAKCLQRIHVITGWKVPEDVGYMKILIEEFVFKIKEDFSMMNFDEIIFGFRKNGLGIKDWGKNMNLDLICSVIGEYAEDRRRLSLEEERLKEPEQKKYTEEELDNIVREKIEISYQYFLKGEMPFLQDSFEEILKKDGYFIDGLPLVDIFKHWRKKRLRKLYVMVDKNGKPIIEEPGHNTFSVVETEINKLYQKFLQSADTVSVLSIDTDMFEYMVKHDKYKEALTNSLRLDIFNRADVLIKEKGVEPTPALRNQYARKIAVFDLFIDAAENEKENIY